MEQIILNGCSYIQGHDEDIESRLDTHIANITGIEPINLSVGGSSNDRIFRTTFEFIEKNLIENSLIVIGLSHWARFEIYSESTKATYQMNFWLNEGLETMLSEIRQGQSEQYLDEEINRMRSQGHHKNMFNFFSTRELKKFTIFYLENLRSEELRLMHNFRELKLLNSYLREKNNTLIAFNSLHGTYNNIEEEFFIKPFLEKDWYSHIMDKREHPLYPGHPDSDSNLEMAKLLIEEYEIRNRH